MAYTPVGVAGAVSTGAAGAAVTPAWGAGSNRLAGNLLLCWVSGTATSATPNASTPAGWNATGLFAGVASVGVGFFYKIATGGDAAPTIALQSGVVWNVQVAELFGNAAAPLDQSPFATAGTTSPLVDTANSADFAAGQLFAYASAARYSASAAKTLANTLNNGATAVSTNNNSAVTGSHYDFGYGITTGNSVADSSSFAFTTTNVTRAVVQIASFRLALVASPAVLRASAPAPKLTDAGTLTGAVSISRGLALRPVETAASTETAQAAALRASALRPTLSGSAALIGPAATARLAATRPSESAASIERAPAASARASALAPQLAAAAALPAPVATLRGDAAPPIAQGVPHTTGGVPLDGGLLIPAARTYTYRDQSELAVSIDFDETGHVTGTSEEELLLVLT